MSENLTHTDEAITLTGDRDRRLERSVKVSFYPSVSDYAHIAHKIHTGSPKPASRALYALNAFLAVNLVGLPATLWYFEMLWAGLAVFILNIVFAIGFLPAVIRQDYERYYQAMFKDLEDHLAEVELTETGVWCRHEDNFSFHDWNAINSLEETKQAIYFYSEHNGIAVSKSGFAYDEQKDQFLTFAKEHVKSSTTN